MHFTLSNVATLLLLSASIEKGLALPTSSDPYDLVVRDDIDDSAFDAVDLFDGNEPDDTTLDDTTPDTADLVTRDEPGDSAANPLKKEFDCTDKNSDYEGLQELFDADCFTHLCGQAPVNMNRWDQQSRARGVEHGNGVSSRKIFGDLKKWHTTRPGDKYVSPEEWPPASSAQGGEYSILFPVTLKAQNRQKVLINNKFYAKKPTVKVQKGLKGDKKGSWFRITEWKGAQGPYCKALNEALKKYDENFDSNGKIKKTPDICTKDKIDLNGLAYDVGKYAYQINVQDKSQYLPVLKALGAH